MELYISEGDYHEERVTDKFRTVENYEDCDTVLILPGGLGCVNDLLNSITDMKKTYVYNKELYYSSFLKNLHESHLRQRMDDMKDSLIVEEDIEKIINKMEEENGKVNNGKTSKLL